MKKLFKTIILLASLTGLGAWGGNAYAAACTSVATGNWSAAATWSCVGLPAATVPGAADTVTIKGGWTVTVPALTTVNAASLTLGGTGAGGGNGALNFTAGSALTVTGAVTFGTGPRTGSIDMTSGGTLTTGSLAVVNLGTWTPGTGTVVMTATNTLPVGLATFNNLTVSGVGTTTTLGQNITLNGALTVTAGTLATSTFTMGVSGDFVVNGTVSGTGAITLSGTNTAIDGTGSVTNTATLTINTGAKTVPATASLTIDSPIAISGAVTVTSNGTITGTSATGITGSVAGSTWTNVANSTLKVAGPLLATGTLNASANPNTVDYTGAGQTVKATSYDTLNITGTATNSGTVTVATALGGAGTLTNAATGILNIGGTSAITTLTATAAGNIVNYTGTAQTVIATAYDTLNVTGTATNSGTVTVAAALGGTGALTNGATGTLNIGGTSAITTLTATAVGNVVNYTGAAAQTVNATTYDTLSFSGAGVKTNMGIVSVNAALSGTALTNGATGTLNIGGTSAITTLTANAAGNTVNYTGAGAQTINATAYSNLILSNSGVKTMTGVTAIGGDLSISGSATMTANAAFTVTGALNYSTSGSTTLTAATPVSIGSFNQSAGTLIDNGNTITVTGTGAATWSQTAGTFTPTGTVIFTGAAPQIGAANFNNVTISIGAGNTATLTGNATASGVLTLTSGLVSTGANSLEITSSCTTSISGASSTNYVLGNLSLHYPTGSTTCTFPIGSAAAYTPATVAMTNVTSTLANSVLSARTDAGDHADTTAGASGIDPAKSVNRFWTLAPGGSLAFATYDATFTFVAGDIDGGAVTANFIIGRKNGVSWYYPTLGAKNPTDTTATGMSQAGGFGEFVIGERIMPSITVLKTVAVYSDPVNLLVNPKHIPGAITQYTFIASNSGGPADDGTTFIVDPVPANTALYVNDIGGAGSGPVLFSQGASSSTLAYTKASDLSFSNDGGATWTAVPVADAFGCDATVPAITHIRVNPKGSFAGSAVAPNPSFQLTFRVCVK